MKLPARITAFVVAIPVAGTLAGLGIASTGGGATATKPAKAAPAAKRAPAVRAIVHQRCHADPRL